MKKAGKPKGLPKTGGRQRGGLNKLPRDLRQSITEFLQANFDEVVKEWEELENPRDKLNFYRDLLRYAVPVLQSTQLTTDFEKLTDEQLDYIIESLKASQNDQTRQD